MTVAPARSDALARAAALTVVVTMSGSLLGFVRDLLLARFFGATGGTDAFLVAWTVPETAFPLVVEGVMSLLMVPLFAAAIAGTGQHQVRDLVAATMPRIVAVLAVASAAVAAGAPLLVRLIAPGLAHPALAVACTRWTALTVLTFGLAGYLSAALRAHHVFGAPAAIHLAYNIGILGLIWALHARYGVLSAAIGVALGSVFMVLVQAPGFVRHVGLPRRLRAAGGVLSAGALAPIALYTLARQAQVFVERFLGSSLPPGTISHLNYAQKVAQVPMLAALLICTVTFPALSREVAAGRLRAAAHRLETDLRAVTALILVAAAYLVAFAPVVIQVLLQHGEFGPADTAATAAILRMYALGLLGQALVGVLCRPFFAAASSRSTWYPAACMGAGLAVTAAVAVWAARFAGGPGIAVANAAGITVTAVLLLAGVRRAGSGATVHLSLSTLVGTTARLVAAAAGAAGAGRLVAPLLHGLPAAATAAAGGLTVVVAFAVLARLAGVSLRWR